MKREPDSATYCVGHVSTGREFFSSEFCQLQDKAEEKDFTFCKVNASAR